LFKNAIARLPGKNFAVGLTHAKLGRPFLAKALEQHSAYCRALEECGVHVTLLDADLQHPDSTFVEDTAVLTRDFAVLTRPGADSRKGEVPAIREAVSRFFPACYQIEPPGTVDGGDICEAEDRFFIGISHRTNEEGARQLAKILAAGSFLSTNVDIRGMKSILHLKSGIAYIGENHMVVMEEMAEREELRGYDLIPVSKQESYAANCIRVNAAVLLPSGFPALESSLKQRGFSAKPLDASEFQKMDGGLSCLSLRF
jgi:dimethylargininase